VTLADIATATLYVLLFAAVALGALIVVGRSTRRRRDERRAKLAAPARTLLLSVASGEPEPEEIERLVRLPDDVWAAVEPNAVAMLGKVRGDARALLVTVFERRGAAWRARSDLRRKDPVKRAQAAEILGTLGRKDSVPALCDLLSDVDPDVRVVAVRALGRIGDAAAAQPLLASVANRRRSVPLHQAAHALAGLGAGGQSTLVAGLDSPYETVRATAAEVLGLIGAVGAVGRIEEVLRTDGSIEVRVRAARTLGRLGPRTALTPLLESLAADRPEALRAELGTTSAADGLTAVLGDSQFAVGHQAARSLLRLGNTGRSKLTAAAAEEHARTGTGSSRVAGRAARRAAAHAREALAVAAVDEQRRTLSTVTG
jgi:HEAT repeat protein